jgi:histidinol-phosphate/aromatic aminotransferase/cobyric acid decarboxylase-like protein
MGKNIGERAVRIAVKDAETNNRMIELIKETLKEFSK